MQSQIQVAETFMRGRGAVRTMKRQNSADVDAEHSKQKKTEDDDQPVGAVLKLQHRKEQLVMRLQEKCSELKKLCMQEFELTGVVPMETPFDANESPPKAKRKIVTMFPYDKELLKELAQAPVEESPKRKALSPWNSCEELPYKATSPYKCPTSPKHNTWTSPQGKGHASARAHLRSTLKFFKKRLQ